MRDQLENRLSDLKNEYDQGQKILAELNEKRENTAQAMLRISGAIQVLEELLAKEESAPMEAIQTEAVEQPIQ
jgi:hypothetical protein